MKLHRRARPLAVMVVLGATAPLLGGCQIWNAIFPPGPDSHVLAGAKAAQADDQKLFSQLQQPAPACAAASVAPLFAAVKADLDKVRADNVPQNSVVEQQAVLLEKQLGDIQAQIPADPGCLPANIAATQQPIFERGLSEIVTAETPKS